MHFSAMREDCHLAVGLSAFQSVSDGTCICMGHTDCNPAAHVHNKMSAVLRQQGAEETHREGALTVGCGRHVDRVNQHQNLWRGLGQVLCYATPQLRRLQCQDPSSQPALSHCTLASHEADDLPASTSIYCMHAP